MEKSYTKYMSMQKEFYEDTTHSSKAIVGNYEWHELYPYETFLLYKRGDVRYPLIDNIDKKIALDFACGPGRMIKRMNKVFKQTDGCDIAKRFLDEAREMNPKSNFYLTNGDDLGDIPENYYDFVYCTISMQHICVHSVRINILKNISKALKDDGCFTLQLAFANDPCELLKTIETDDEKVLFLSKQMQHAKWDENRINAESTNSGCDVMITKKDLPQVVGDFEEIFSDIDFWFSDIKEFNNIPELSLEHSKYWATHWIYIHGKKK